MTIGYAITLAFAVGLLIAYLIMVKNKEFWLTMLYAEGFSALVADWLRRTPLV